MPHGPQAGSVALLDERGNVVWERQMWEPHSIIAPDGSYVVVQGAARKLREEEEPEEPDVVTSLVDRTGKTLVVARLPKISPPWFVSTDSKLIVFHEYIAGHWWLVVRDRSLNAVSRTRDVPNFGPCHSDSGLIVVGENNTLRAYRLPG